ncbi:MULTISPECIES: aromatic-ring-hydroxylating dioxygenase subunit beta [Marinomonas]|uniref:3-phenylpropionate/cinnamic acid dioxygenase small subunit n=1 Tax=Marinomonas balearica TaxID=491947 RepID=A0A4R6M476_9GAMM|nr:MULTISPECIES: aromatic-ring-hydroxylating dioxygenase subunit beta [Marinomonas]TDO95495.1 3-phenylpropionate/cinnamic acid dioxygenase small subunit [Marinomonas balearica]WCN14819.1 hypothetical protein GV054_18325 [Marinomonas mediterranea]
MTVDANLVNNVTAFIWHEADLLDHKEYQDWLTLWNDSGLYIVPTDNNETDYEATLNLALDDKDMRRMRVTRLESGESVSAGAASMTVRMMSRVRIVEQNEEQVTARCAMTLNELRHGKLITYPADVEYILTPKGSSYSIQRKVVKLLHADGYLRTVSFIF